MNAIKLYGAAMFGAAFIITQALAHDHATGVVKERMEMMEAMGKNMKAIGDRIKNNRDLAPVKKDAKAVFDHSQHLVHLFPPGSTQRPTDARDAIWKNWPDFEAKAKALATASKSLVDADPADTASLTAKFRAVSQSCGGCHELYRVKR